MFNLAFRSVRHGIVGNILQLALACSSWHSLEALPASAAWFPDPPTVRHYAWHYDLCEACEALAPRPEWMHMAALAGIPKLRVLLSLDESNGPAYSAAPNVLVLTPAALKMDACQLAFVIGHEIVHIAQRHFDEDATAMLVYSGMPSNWTDKGEEALQLADGDFGLALRVSHLWQDQEREADWIGALLAAQSCGCDIESSALAYLRHEREAGGGLAAAHPASMERVRRLLPFAESAKRLAERSPR